MIPTKAGPGDLVFAGSPRRAYVSCSRANVVQVFDPIARSLVTEIPIAGDRPKALAVSPDGAKVYAAILESGNATTIIAPRFTHIAEVPPPGALSDPDGPYAGQDPPPNAGTAFVPAINPYVEPTSQPKGSLVVRKNAVGQWMDDNAHDWTEFISGPKAASTGRVPGWDMPDRDLAVIDTATHAVSYATGLMNICMATAVNPATGKIAVVGTEALNHVRFEPQLKSVFLRVNVALVDPATLGKTIRDLNPHLDYAVRSVPQNVRDLSLGDPRGLVWNAAGTRGYITGMGSRNLIVIDADGQRVQAAPVELGEGPTGLALDEARSRLYVFNRFAGSLSTVDTTTLAVVSTLPFADSTPEFIREGRRLFFDTRHTSRLGQVSCASCHVDVRFDRLAWDLGIPNGETQTLDVPVGTALPVVHPMKGPMVTLTLQGFVAQTGSFHWIGDRIALASFDVTFPDLLGMERIPTRTEMSTLLRYLTEVRFPPNPFRTLDNGFAPSVPLPGHVGPSGTPLPPGNAKNGLSLFRTLTIDLPPLEGIRCESCHDAGSGRGVETRFSPLPRNDNLLFRGTPLRSVGEKIGLDLSATESRAGFGFLHDGRSDTLSRFLSTGFAITAPQDIADLTAFMLSFPGGLEGNSDGSHGVNDAHAALGKQVFATDASISPLLNTLLSLGNDEPPWARKTELIAWQRAGSAERAWFYDIAAQRFLESERPADRFTVAQLLALATPAQPVVFLAVSASSGRRHAIDFDEDGLGNLVEIAQGSDPLNRASPALPPISGVGNPDFGVGAHPGQTVDQLLTLDVPNREGHQIIWTLTNPATLPPGATLTAEGRFQWTVPVDSVSQLWQSPVSLQVVDQAGFTISGTLVIYVGPLNVRMEVVTFNPNELPDPPLQLRLSWDGFFGRSYEIQASDDLIAWQRLARRSVFGLGSFEDWSFQSRPKRFYRIVPAND